MGHITHIQRMSIHDGPGIRSTIFLKGCNLRCKWCHNPETFLPIPQLSFNPHKCIGCRQCLEVCSEKALFISEDKINFSNALCSKCFKCVGNCYANALQTIGKEVNPQQIYTEIEQDFPFFATSNGGITISGGEPMMQSKFTANILEMFFSKKIHTALETNLTFSWSEYEKILPVINLLMVDLKIFDNNKHIKWTGSSNLNVLNNIMELDKSNIPYIVRTPLIPGVNDDPCDKEQIVNFTMQLKNMLKHEFLPYHALGSVKYTNLGYKYYYNSNTKQYNYHE